MTRTLGVVVAVLLVTVNAGCARDEPTADAGAADGPYDIVCTVGMVADIVRQVTGDRAVVTNIIGEGVDPHLYTVTRSDVIRLTDADVIFYSGLMLEGKMGDTLVRLARSGRPVYAVTELIDPSYLLEPEGFAGHADPHVWMDVGGWMQAVEAVAVSMGEVDPAHVSLYRANAERALAELRELDDYVRSSLATIPRVRRVLVTAHDAFSYFGRAYDIEVLGIQGISTESEAGLERINRLVNLIVRRGVPAVFVETSVADENVRALVEGAAAGGHELVIGGTLFSDAMGAPGTYEGTYMGMLDHNATVVTRALGGTAPPRGLRGKLGAGAAR